MTSLAIAVEKREWRLVSLYLLLGVSDAASRLPPETLSELVDLLGGEETSRVSEAKWRQRRGR